MVPPIHLGAWSMALMLWLPFELLLLLLLLLLLYKYLLASWEVPSLFSCFFVYEHAHLTADYRGRDLASLPYGEGKLTRISVTVRLERKDR